MTVFRLPGFWAGICLLAVFWPYRQAVSLHCPIECGLDAYGIKMGIIRTITA